MGDIPKSFSSTYVILCVLSSTGTSCSSNSGQAGPLQSQNHTSNFIPLPTYIAPLLSKIRQIFQFKEHIIDESQKLLHIASRDMKNITYVVVHVRRTDYIGYLNRKFNASIVKPDYFLRHKNVFRNKYKPIIFVVVSDDPKWCERELRGDDVVVMKTNPPVQELAIISACNHSIID